MSEQKIPIPAMLYNAAVGGHVTNSQQIIDENLNREQNDINQETVGAVLYNSTTPNGMGRVVLKKNDNFKTVVEAQTNGNTIFVIKYDFTLTGNVTIPTNCILKFDGGSINGAYSLIGNYTCIDTAFTKIFNENVAFGGTWKITTVYPEWWGAKGDAVTDDHDSFIAMFKFIQSTTTAPISNLVYNNYVITLSSNKVYYFEQPVTFSAGHLGQYLHIEGNQSYIKHAGFNFTESAGYRLKVYNLNFVSMDYAFNLSYQNSEYSNFYFERCLFNQVTKVFTVARRSSMIEICNCAFQQSVVGEFTDVDRLYFHHNWIETNIPENTDYFSVIKQNTGNEGAMFIYDNLFVPTGGVNCKELAWIEVNEHARIYNNRFGGENVNYHPVRLGSGFAPKGGGDSKYPYLSFDHNDEVSGKASIVIESIAGNVIIDGNLGWQGDFRGIVWSDKLSSSDIETMLSAQQYMLNISVKDNVGRSLTRTQWDISLPSNKPFIPEELWPFVNRGLHNAFPGRGNYGGCSYITTSNYEGNSIDIVINSQPFYNIHSSYEGGRMAKVANFKLLLLYSFGWGTNYDFDSYACIISFDFAGNTITPKINYISGTQNSDVSITIEGGSSVTLEDIGNSNTLTFTIASSISNKIIKGLKVAILDVQNSQDLYV